MEAFEGRWELSEISIAFPIQPLDLLSGMIAKSIMTRRFTRGIIKAP